jgi:hypothetical protein
LDGVAVAVLGDVDEDGVLRCLLSGGGGQENRPRARGAGVRRLMALWTST